MKFSLLGNMNLKQRFYIASIPVLLGVLVFQLRNTNLETDSADQVSVSGAVGEQKRTEKKETTDTRSGNAVAKWPQFDSAAAPVHNPFSRELLFPRRSAQLSNQSAIDESRSQYVSSGATPKREELGPVKAIYQSGRGAVALVGDRLIRVGDRLEDGSVVMEITTEKIVLSNPSIH